MISALPAFHLWQMRPARGRPSARIVSWPFGCCGQPDSERLSNCSSFTPLASRSVHSPCFSPARRHHELLHYFFVAPHGETIYDLPPHRLRHQRSALEQLITAPGNLAVVLRVPDPRLLDRNFLSGDHHLASFGSPAISFPLRIGFGSFAGHQARGESLNFLRSSGYPRCCHRLTVPKS
jgi:hypothetical protein